MTKYYKVLFDDQGSYGVARTTERGELFALSDRRRVEDWKPLALELRDGTFADYLASNLGCRLCSERLRSILHDHASPLDQIQWLNVEVFRGTEKRTYAILHFPSPPDVLNMTMSIVAGDFVVKPVLSKQAVEGHDVFSFPNGGELPLFVSEPVKRAIVAAGCTGLELSQAPIR